MAPTLLVLSIVVAACACVFAGIALVRYLYRGDGGVEEAQQLVEQARSENKVQVVTGSVQITRPKPHSVEGLEIQYGSEGLVRSVCVGAMNVEHKELLLIMDSVAWQMLPNAHKQEVLAAARSTWAAKMCADGPDVAYVIIKTERGEVVGRADPRCVTLI